MKHELLVAHIISYPRWKGLEIRVKQDYTADKEKQYQIHFDRALAICSGMVFLFDQDV